MPLWLFNIVTLAITTLKGVGSRLAAKLQKLSIYNVQDLLFHLPVRYEDRTRITPIRQCQVGQHAVIEGEVIDSSVQYGKRRSLLCYVKDRTGTIVLRFFYFNSAQQNKLSEVGLRIRCYGEVRFGKGGVTMIHPECRYLNDENTTPVEETLTPVYPATEGIGQALLRKLSKQALNLLDQQISLPDLLPADEGLPDLHSAIRYLHQPPPDAHLDKLEMGIHPAQQRLAFEELTAHQLSLRRLRHRARQDKAPAILPSGELCEAFLQQLPFRLTSAQQRVSDEIKQDLTCSAPMMRLLQGDVGSGKTVVAVLAALQAVEAGFQAALMAPTELLAEQHLQNLTAWLSPLGVKVEWLASKMTAKNRREALEKINSGEAQIIVGTHALFQAGVDFHHLGLLIIDEQHRFGVHQRLALREKGVQAGLHPHQLIMTATPIPRTLAMTAYADLDNSVIDELPPGRKPVVTVVVSNQKRQDVLTRVQANCQTGRQAYWVCTLIEESEVLQCQAAQITAQDLQAQLTDLKVGLIHGRLKPAEKAQIMKNFKQGDIDLLVATTVIEVGVDVPNASLMIIENPERLGLAQLHQLRGRVGRGTTESHCVMLYQYPLSQQARKRLDVMRNCSDGFAIAQHDLEIRGPGEVLGTRQTGLMQFRVADIMRDQCLLPKVREMADKLLQNQPENVEPLIARWLTDREQYGSV